MNVSRRRYMGEKGGSIPYQRIEYLESNPSKKINNEYHVGQVINLYTPTSEDEVIVVFSPLDTVLNAFFGARSSDGLLRFCCTTFSSGSQTAFAMTYNTWPANRVSVVIGNTYTMSAKNGSYSINGVEYTSTSIQSSYTFSPFLMFCCNNSSGLQIYSKMRCYSVVVRRSGNVIHDFIPVRIGTTGYMYDTISGELFGNAGTGDFTLGPDIN